MKRWLVLLRIPIALAAVGLFFAGYSRFLLNANLQNLKTSLSVLDAATGVGQAEAALLLVDQTLVSEMAREEMDLQALAALQYAQGSLSADQRTRPVEDVQVMVANLAEEQRSARPPLLNTLDGVVAGTQRVFRRAALLPRQITAGPLSREIDHKSLSEAARWERLGALPKAARIYEKLLADHPDYADRSAIWLRLGYVYQRLRSPDQAERLYRQVLAQTRKLTEAEAAQRLLAQLSQARALEASAKSFKQRLARADNDAERQKISFELGSVLIRMYALEEASQAFRQAALYDLQGEFGNASLFKEAWCLRTLGRFDEALTRFQELIHKDAKNPLASASVQQVSEAYRAMGNYKAAVSVSESLSREVEDKTLAPALKAQTGATYRYDLKNAQKAQEVFQELAQAYAASPFSEMGRQMKELEAEKAEIKILPALSAIQPATDFLERSLPAFVEVFATQLTRYMKGVGEPGQLTRRFTEEEFRAFVLPRLQERFPGQLTDFTARIQPDGYVGSANLRLGPAKFFVEGRVGITLVDDRPHVLVYEFKIGRIPIPQAFLQTLESRVNLAIDRQIFFIRVTRYDLRNGYAVIQVELVQ